MKDDAVQKQNTRQNKGLCTYRVCILFKRTRLKEYKVQIIRLLPVFIPKY
jgi:hypothetical protein